MNDIRESEEVLALATDLASTIKAAKADGQTNVWDAPKFLKLIPELMVAIDGSEKIGAEIEGLDEATAKKLAGDAIAALHSLFDALTSKPGA